MDPEQKVVVSPRHYFSISYRKKNRRQADALFSADLILLAVGCCIFPILYHGTLGIGSESQTLAFHTVFFAGNIIGTVIGAFLLGKFNKKIIYYACAAITILAGVLKVAKGKFKLEIDDINQFLNIHIAANFFIGIAFGICLLTSVIYAGEVSVRYLRGTNALSLQTYIDVGVLIAIEIYAIILNLYLRDITAISLTEVQATGLTMILAGVICLLTVSVFVIESPEFLIQNGDESEARKNLMRLRRAEMETLEIIRDLDETKQTIRESDMKNPNLIGKFIQVDDLMPLIKIFLLRLAYLMGTGLPINRIMLRNMLAFLQSTQFSLPFIMVKLIGHCICFFTIDRFGRKPMLIISLGLCGILALVFNSIYLTERDNIIDEVTSNITKILFFIALIYQLALGLGAGVPYIYMCESFEHSRKIYLCAIIFIAESLIQIIIYVSIDYNVLPSDGFFFFTGILQVLVALAIFKFLPETTGKSLRESKELMQKLY